MEQPGFEFLYSEHVVRHEEPGEDSEVNLPKKSSDEIVWGSWWSDSSSSKFIHSSILQHLYLSIVTGNYIYN